MDRLSAMEVFVRVVETGTFSGAARQLHIGQPAVSKTVSQLEKWLGVHLLLRSNRGLMPTEAGRSFYDGAKRAIVEADEAERAARGAGVSLSGRLRVCAAVTFSRLHVIPHLAAFLAQHPDLDIEIIMDDRPIDLVEGGIDVALRMGSLSDSTLTARKIGQCGRFVLGTPAYFERAGVPSTPDDLAHHQAVFLERSAAATVWTFQRGTIEVSVSAKRRIRVTAGEGVRAAVLADLGLTVSSEWLFAPELQAGTVKLVLEDWLLPPLDLWAVFPTGRRASAKARAFATFVETVVAQAQTPAAAPPAVPV